MTDESINGQSSTKFLVITVARNQAARIMTKMDV